MRVSRRRRACLQVSQAKAQAAMQPWKVHLLFTTSTGLNQIHCLNLHRPNYNSPTILHRPACADKTPPLNLQCSGGGSPTAEVTTFQLMKMMVYTASNIFFLGGELPEVRLRFPCLPGWFPSHVPCGRTDHRHRSCLCLTLGKHMVFTKSIHLLQLTFQS